MQLENAGILIRPVHAYGIKGDVMHVALGMMSCIWPRDDVMHMA